MRLNALTGRRSCFPPHSGSHFPGDRCPASARILTLRRRQSAQFLEPVRDGFDRRARAVAGWHEFDEQAIAIRRDVPGAAALQSEQLVRRAGSELRIGRHLDRHERPVWSCAAIDQLVRRAPGPPCAHAALRPVVRGLSGVLSMAAVGLGGLWILRDPEQQAWHDRIAGTYVVKVPRDWPIG